MEADQRWTVEDLYDEVEIIAMGREMEELDGCLKKVEAQGRR